MRIRKLIISNVNENPSEYRPWFEWNNQLRNPWQESYSSHDTMIAEIGERAFTAYYAEIIFGTNYVLSRGN